MWSQMHGFVAGFNNTLLDYMHDSPETLKDQILKHTFSQFRNEIMRRQKAGSVVPLQRN
jgi:hypothetical protein